MNSSRRLFQEEKILYHPDDMTMTRDEIPEGEIKGWECYAYGWDHGNDVEGPFTAIVRRREGILSITTPEGVDYFYNGFKWTQSGVSLKFIRPRDN